MVVAFLRYFDKAVGRFNGQRCGRKERAMQEEKKYRDRKRESVRSPQI